MTARLLMSSIKENFLRGVKGEKERKAEDREILG